MSARRDVNRPERRLRPGWFFLPRLSSASIEGAPEWMWGLRALFVSDVHLRHRVGDEPLEALIELFASARADLLLLGGDYAESEADCRRFFRALSKLRFPLGAFAVPGNNDGMERGELRSAMAEAGVELLVNESRRIPLPGGELRIGGCDEYKYGEPRTEGLFPEGGYRILLSHYPRLPECACELMLSGHTHAGQLRLLGLTPYSLGFERKLRPLAVHGLHRVEGMHLLVSGGIGVSRLPLRLNAEPEIHLLTFCGEKSRAKLPEN